MNYAIVEINGEQCWIEAGKYYDFNRIPIKPFRPILLTKILLAKKDEKLYLGKPYLKNVIIHATILQQFRKTKAIVFKMKSKKNFKRKHGHRQLVSRVFINNIIIN